MHTLVNLDKTQLNRIDAAITTLAQRPFAEREKKRHLLLALELEKKELLRCNPALRVVTRAKAA